MAGLCEGGNEPSGSLKAICKRKKRRNKEKRGFKVKTEDGKTENTEKEEEIKELVEIKKKQRKRGFKAKTEDGKTENIEKEEKLKEEKLKEEEIKELVEMKQMRCGGSKLGPVAVNKNNMRREGREELRDRESNIKSIPQFNCATLHTERAK
ncbi:hypothetical protein ANN_12412 [Periplaneta americana]|uniref:Uncharacterized protein n=1 Tax=Periplaneta americana TaxID=6978 RepID=A0ABQ8TIZ6_PERAM|nr:hypothetical protein ANN_12412 [Periplaneta americana]